MKKFLPLLFLLLPLCAWAADTTIGGLPAVTVSAPVNGSQTYSLSLQVLIAMTLISLLPAALMMMTSFTRIIVVLSILRQAIGLQQTPSNQILLGMALFMTLFVMTPVIKQIDTNALEPYLNNQITTTVALEKAKEPLQKFMLHQTRETDLEVYTKIAGIKQLTKPEDVPFTVLMPAFVTSELKTAFQMGFLLFLPFLVIDLVVASVLMSLGMMMLSPLIISLPFKILLFVLVDGWTLIMGTLASSFGT